MHVSYQLAREHFASAIDGVEVEREEVLPGWNTHDRFGIIVDRPYGAVGASLLIQLAITAYYDIRETRRTGAPIYPEVYVFHVGRYHGSHAWYDVFPPRKEVLVPDSPAEILEAINDRAITRLAVVDGTPRADLRHHLKEPATALDRIESAWAYSPTGRVADADLSIRALHRRGVKNTTSILTPGSSYDEVLKTAAENKARLLELNPGGVPEDDGDMIEGPDRSAGIDDAEIARLAAQRDEISENGLPRETYRRIPVADAIRMLPSGA
ncbi:hypothetical protein ABCS02_32500 [Microbacterium sp. X-17]|uniref:hypothetical protein n=1 Tax=Microbacterium sp. X-17 TaxID=3144404 RepID=UPI0031F4B7F6